jgi:hypothetical protein
MPEVRVQDEQGNIHVFPDGSTPEMIAQAMGVKPPSTPAYDAYKQRTAAGPFAKPGEAEKAMGEGATKSQLLMEAARGPALGAAAVAPMLTGGASLPVQAAVSGLSAAAQTKLEGGSNKAAGLSGAIGTAIPVAGHYASEAAGPMARRLYQSALKPSTRITPERVASIVETGLTNQIPVSEAGTDRLAGLIDDVNDKIKNVIASDPNRPINKFAVASRLSDTAKKFATQVTPEADLAAVSQTGNEFLASQPAEIPAAQAQAMKQGTYQQLSGKAYGELKSASIESQKALARGLKEELATQFPELQTLNARDSKLYDLDGALTKAVQRISNHQIIGIGTPIMAGAGSAVANSAKVGVVSGLIKAVLDDPVVKSKLAIVLSRAGGQSRTLGAVMNQISAYSLALGSGANAVPPGGQASGQSQQ